MPLRICLAQLDFHVGAIEANAELIIKTARDCHGSADLIVFPELALTGYPPEDLLLRAQMKTRVNAALEYIAKQVHEPAVLIGYPAYRQHGCFNAAGVIQHGEIQVEYHKHVLPNYSVFDEKRYFLPGHLPAVVKIQGVSVGITICEDIWFPEPAKLSAEAGAEVLVNINASPFHKGKFAEREQEVMSRARENNLPVLYLNLVGGQDELVFDGSSFVIDRDGSLVSRLQAFEKEASLITYDGGLSVLPKSMTQIPSEEEQVYRALVLAVRDYVTKNGFAGTVIGLSGGIDSALTLAIAADALGAENVEAVLMPSQYTAEMSNEDAIREADELGVRYITIPITPAFDAFQNMLADEFSGFDRDVTEENIQARCRGIILMAISNKSGRMLLTTGNKSEMAVGYATLYGDMAGGFAPLKDVPKTLVYRLSRWRNREKEVIPQRVIDRPPSAELSPDQKDTDSLPDYDVMDRILEMYVEQDMSRDEIIKSGLDEDAVNQIARLVDHNEYKRRQAPPGVKITQRAFGRDRRYPITSGF